MSGSVTKNTAFMTMASVMQKVLSFFYFTLIARHIGADATGKYFLALSLTTIFVVFVDLGLNNVLIRESAKQKNKAQNYFANIIFLKIFLGLFSYLALFLVVNFLNYDIEVKNLVYLSGLTMLFDSVHLSIYGVLRSFGRLKFEAIGIVLSQFLTLSMGTIFLYLNFPLIFLILAFTIPSFLNVVYSASILYFKFSIKLRPNFDKNIIKYFAKIAIPFALAAIFARVYSYIDSVLLSKLISTEAVGWYSIPYKITYAFQFVPLALVAGLYPRFSELFVVDKKRLSIVLQNSLKYLLIVVFPIVVGIGVLASDIILSIYGVGYYNSILPLQILLVGLLFSYISFPLGAFLNACNMQVKQTTIVFFAMVLNIVLNIVLIPKLSVVGASISALGGNMLLAVSAYLLVPRVIAVSHSYILKSFLQVFVSAGVMGVVVYLVNIQVHYTLAIVIGVLVYPFMLFITRAVNTRQIREMLGVVKIK